mmetsp:Transcript_102519/g.275636  ORF Transcript_102519/g.275636 Transcript_102519/m.275636 type:complete len:251 (-) Transcript_102519:1318-2070(-)
MDVIHHLQERLQVHARLVLQPLGARPARVDRAQRAGEGRHQPLLDVPQVRAVEQGGCVVVVEEAEEHFGAQGGRLQLLVPVVCDYDLLVGTLVENCGQPVHLLLAEAVELPQLRPLLGAKIAHDADHIEPIQPLLRLHAEPEGPRPDVDRRALLRPDAQHPQDVPDVHALGEAHLHQQPLRQAGVHDLEHASHRQVHGLARPVHLLVLALPHKPHELVELLQVEAARVVQVHRGDQLLLHLLWDSPAEPP